MSIKHSKINQTLAESIENFMADAKNFTEGCSKSFGSSYLIKKNGVISLVSGSKKVIIVTPNSDGSFNYQFMFNNNVTFKRIQAVLDHLNLEPLGLYSPTTSVMRMTRADGTDIKLSTGVYYDYSQLLDLYNSTGNG